MGHLTQSEKILSFVSFCIEEYKTRGGTDGGRTADLFEKFGVLDYLVEHYEVLHSLGREAILDDIEHFIDVRREQK